jgi:hypothetical protein
MFVSLIQENQERLVPWLKTHNLGYSTIFNFSFEEIRGRIAAIKDGSGPASSSGSSIASPVFRPELERESGAASSSGSSMQSTSTPADEPTFQASISRFHMGKHNDYQSSGFSAFEGTHRWTVGKEATITIPLAEMERRPSRISFLNTAGFVTANHPQNLIVKVNGVKVNSYVYTPADNNKRINVPLPTTGPAEIEFEMPDAISPSVLVGTPDKRELGILFKEVEFHY